MRILGLETSPTLQVARPTWQRCSLGDGGLFLASKEGDIKTIAAAFKVDVGDFYWSILFSNKHGAAALSLYPCPDQQGDINSRQHKPPKGFDKSKLTNIYFAAATAEQLRAAGWRTSKQAKN